MLQERMSNLGQSVVYSPGRMKASQIINKFLYSLYVQLFVVSLLQLEHY